MEDSKMIREVLEGMGLGGLLGVQSRGGATASRAVSRQVPEGGAPEGPRKVR